MRFDFRLYGSYLLNAVVAMVGFVFLHALYDTVRTSTPRPAILSFATLVVVSLLAGLAAGLVVARAFRMHRYPTLGGTDVPGWMQVNLMRGDAIGSCSGIVEMGHPTPDLSGTDVLIVDDQEQQSRVLSEALQEVGASVRTASTVEEATKAVEQRSPDVLVSDLILRPGEDLHMLMANLEIRRPKGNATLRIAVSAYPEVIDEAKVAALGFDAYLPRPFTAADLATLISLRLSA